MAGGTSTASSPHLVPPAEEAAQTFPRERLSPPAAAGASLAGAATALAQAAENGPLRILFQDVTVASGQIRVRTPWTARMSGGARARALQEARSGTSPWALHETPEGEFENLYELSNLRGRFPLLRITDPEAPLLIELENLSGTLRAVNQPLELERLTGSLTLADTAHIAIEQFQTDGSLVRGTGWLAGADPMQYAFELDAEPIDVRDLRWLPIDLPEVGGGPMRVNVRSRGSTTVVDVSNGDFRTGDTRLTGGFGLAIGPRPRFESLDVALAPFALEHLDALMGRETTRTGDPVGDASPDPAAGADDPAAGADAAAANAGTVVRTGTTGWARGTIRGAGYIDDLTIDADLTLERPGAETLPSHFLARGGVAFRPDAAPAAAAADAQVEALGLRGLEVTLDGFESHWTRLLGMDLGIDGRFGGTLTLDRDAGGAVDFTGSVEHLTTAGDISRFTGSGRLDLDGAGVDATLQVNPLSLSLLRPWASGVELAGNVTGPVRAQGRREALAIEARLESDLGGLNIDGEFDLASEDLRYDTRIEGTDLSLDQWIEGAPTSRLAIRGRAEGTGVDPASLEATFDLDILSSQVDQAEVYDSHLRFRIADGLATIDSLFLATDVGTLGARGDFGLVEGREGVVVFEADFRSLADWDRWFEGEIPGGAAAEAGEALFESIEAVLGDRSDTPTQGLEGQLRARGAATGRFEDFTVAADIEATEARFRRHRADRVQARVELLRPPGGSGFHARLAATDAALDGRRLDSVFVRLDRAPVVEAAAAPAGTAPAGTDAFVYARRDSSVEFAARADVTTGDIWSAGLSEFRLRLGKLESRLAQPARLVYSDSGLVVDDLWVEGQLGRLRAAGRIPAAGEGELSLELFGVRIDQFRYLLASVMGGTLGGSATVTGTLAAPEFEGTLDILQPSVRDQTFGALNSRFSYAERMLQGTVDLVDDGQTLGSLGGTVATDLSLVAVERRFLDDPLDLNLRGDRLPLALVELFIGGLQAVTGTADADLALRGSPGRLRYSGDVRLADGRAWVPELGVWFTDIGAEAEFRGSSVAHVDSIYISSDLGGSARAGGSVDIARIQDPDFDLDFETFAFHAVARRDMNLAASGAGRLLGSYTEPLVTGDFVLTDGFLEQDEFLRAQQILDLADLLEGQAASERRILERFLNPFMENLVVDARVALGPELRLRSPEMEVDLVSEGLDIYLDRGDDSIYVMGEVELARGTYLVDIPPYVRPLRITDGTIRFVGDPDFNPNLDITAEYRDRTIDGPVVVEAHIAGPLRGYEVFLTSNPPMSDADRWCLLAVGAPCYRSADRELGGRLLRAVFSPVSSGINAALAGTTGLTFFNVTSVGPSGPGGVAANRSVFERTAVEVGFYWTNDLFFSAWQPLGGGPPRATVEWSFLPSWSIEARAASRFDERLFGLAWGSNLANDLTFRLFLFREWTLGGGSP
ncbi:translocation/assembly module TamB domain-containing protein [Candidatus Palauibacter sp.]|uniref:translocation/assembly module TamB domain-containing protein n=1 Tax=Candidatus Palauibacter sp. TaxID=3101350 RepID=UPI003B023910